MRSIKEISNFLLNQFHHFDSFLNPGKIADTVLIVTSTV